MINGPVLSLTMTVCSLVTVISVSAAVFAAFLAAVLWMISRKSAGEFPSFVTIKNSSDLTVMISK